MPIYEFYCEDCHTIFNFFSSQINTDKRPLCPKCEKTTLKRQVSLFAFTGKTKEADQMNDPPFGDGEMDQVAQMVTREAEKIKSMEDDPRQAANMMRKLSDMTGLKLGKGLDEALARMERGENSDQVEAEMGDTVLQEGPFLLPGKTGARGRAKRPEPFRDETLYDL